MSGIIAVAIFIFSLVFSLTILSLWLRIAIRYLHISTVQKISQLIYKITNPLVNPIQSILKQKPQAKQKFDTPALITLVVVELLKIIILSLLMLQGLIPITFIFIYVLADLIIQPCDILFFAILIRIIMSFVNPSWQGPIAEFLRQITEPLLKFGRKTIPEISGFDLSPFIVMVLLKIISLFINASLPWRLL
jgi:YggT family protein